MIEHCQMRRTLRFEHENVTACPQFNIDRSSIELAIIYLKGHEIFYCD